MTSFAFLHGKPWTRPAADPGRGGEEGGETTLLLEIKMVFRVHAPAPLSGGEAAERPRIEGLLKRIFSR
jgi:hypothetical protein